MVFLEASFSVGPSVWVLPHDSFPDFVVGQHEDDESQGDQPVEGVDGVHLQTTVYTLKQKM